MLFILSILLKNIKNKQQQMNETYVVSLVGCPGKIPINNNDHTDFDMHKASQSEGRIVINNACTRIVDQRMQLVRQNYFGETLQNN